MSVCLCFRGGSFPSDFERLRFFCIGNRTAAAAERDEFSFSSPVKGVTRLSLSQGGFSVYEDSSLFSRFFLFSVDCSVVSFVAFPGRLFVHGRGEAASSFAHQRGDDASCDFSGQAQSSSSFHRRFEVRGGVEIWKRTEI